jgi:hypothetical protein
MDKVEGGTDSGAPSPDPGEEEVNDNLPSKNKSAFQHFIHSHSPL